MVFITTLTANVIINFYATTAFFVKQKSTYNNCLYRFIGGIASLPWFMHQWYFWNSSKHVKNLLKQVYICLILDVHKYVDYLLFLLNIVEVMMIYICIFIYQLVIISIEIWFYDIFLLFYHEKINVDMSFKNL